MTTLPLPLVEPGHQALPPGKQQPPLRLLPCQARLTPAVLVFLSLAVRVLPVPLMVLLVRSPFPMLLVILEFALRQLTELILPLPLVEPGHQALPPGKTTAATQTFTLSDSTDTGGSGINVAGGSCTTGSNNGDTCTINISDNAGNSTTCTSPINRVDAAPPTINSITADQELATPSGESVTLTVSGLADTGGSGLASLKYSYFVPGSSSWNQVTVANTNSSASFAIPITKEGTYYIKAVAIDSASNLSNEVETSIFINRGTFTASPSPSPVPSFTKPLQIKDIAKGSYVSFNNYLFVKLGNIGESGPFLAVSPLCEQPLVLTSSGILDNTNTIYTGNLPTPGQTTVALVSSPDSSMHGTCTWSSATNPSLSSITSYLDSNHCIANLNTSTTTSYTVSMTGCLTNPTTSLTVSLAEFAGE